MDRKYAKLNGGFAQLSHHIREMQADNFRVQQRESDALRRFEYSIAGAIVLMVLGVTIYGHKMGQAMTAVMAEKERYMVELRQGHEKLAGKTREQQVRLQALLAATKSIAEERLDTRVPVEANDEIGLLAESFNHMAAELQKSKTNDQDQVAEIQRMVESVRSSKNFFHSLVESLPLYLFRKDTDGRYIFVNALACERLGKSMEDILGFADADLVERGLAEKWQEHETAVLRDGTSFESDETFQGSDGVTLHFHVIRSPVFNTEGVIVGIQGIVLDITARKGMEQDLASAQARLVEASRQAGMAEVATGVLHNVGNVLNSVNVSAGLVVEHLRKSKTTSLAKAVELLRSHKDDVGEFLATDPKGRQIPAFLEAVSEQLTREQTALAREAQELQQNIEHMKQIVAMQQSYAKVSGALENLPLHELVEDALRMSSAALARHQIEVVRQFDSVPPVLVDRHLALQILINLVNNAKYALDQRSEGRQLVLRISHLNGECVRLEVNDNGMGIPQENLSRIFNHGFTTKKSGHGFGLHSGANAAKEMGGSLNVHSDGPGAGATFILELPITATRLQAAA
jgi:PAS domain S-box-containing protein